MSMNIEVLLSPAEYQARHAREATGEVWVVFDVLRATSVMVAGLAQGAAGFLPVAEIPEALAGRAKYPDALLAGEREGLRITASHSGGVEFDLGNSPREFTRARVAGRMIIATTTNGTKALRAGDSADALAVGSFLNLTATAQWLVAQAAQRVVLVCAGTWEAPALEDVLGAGALCERLTQEMGAGPVADSAAIARRLYQGAAGNLLGALEGSRNGRRLLANPDLQADVAFCLQRDVVNLVGVRGADGVIRSATS